MEGQITLTEWMQWREDIRRKLQETASNFVYIGYRLKQIRDSGMYDGCEDIFEFAQKEYGLSKSITSRFIAINEKFSEGGNSLEIREEYKTLGSSKLSEMLTLSEEDCQMITAKTTVKEIRELKHFNKQEPEEIPADPEPAEVVPKEPTEQVQTPETAMAVARNPIAVQYTPLQKCIMDFFKDRKEVIKEVMELLDDGWQIEEAAKVINPGEHMTHKKGIVFLFMYDFKTGVAYKLMGQPEPVKMPWDEFLNEVAKVYGDDSQGEDFEAVWDRIYPSKMEAKTEEKMPENRVNTPVATSQQSVEKAQKIPPKETVEEVRNAVEEVPEEHIVDVNNMLPEDHSSQVEEKAAEENPTAYKMSAVASAAEAGEMVNEDHNGEATEKVEDSMAAAPVKLTEEETEVIEPHQNTESEWKFQIQRCMSNLQAEVEADAWEAAMNTVKSMERFLSLIIKEEG